MWNNTIVYMNTFQTFSFPPICNQLSGASGNIAETDIEPASGVPHLEKDINVNVKTDLLKV